MVTKITKPATLKLIEREQRVRGIATRSGAAEVLIIEGAAAAEATRAREAEDRAAETKERSDV